MWTFLVFLFMNKELWVWDRIWEEKYKEKRKEKREKMGYDLRKSVFFFFSFLSLGIRPDEVEGLVA